MSSCKLVLGDILRYNGGISVPRNRVSPQLKIPYLHYGDIYKIFDFLIDIKSVYGDINKISDKEKFNENHFLNDGDLVINLTSENEEDLCKTVYIKNEDNIQFVAGMETTVVRLIDEEKVTSKYLNVIFQSKNFRKEMKQYISGFKVFRVNPNDISRISIEVPDLITQKKITNQVYKAKELILSLQNEKEKIEELIQKFYQFTVHGKIDYTSKNAKENPAKVFLTERAIKEGWYVTTFMHYEDCDILGSGIMNFTGEKTYYATADIDGTTFIKNGVSVTYKKRPSRANMQPVENSLWFAKMMESRKLILVTEYNDEALNNHIYSTGFTGVKVNEGLYFLWSFVCSDYFLKRRDSLCSGTTQKAINLDGLSRLEIIVPPKRILEDFEQKVEIFNRKIYLINKKIELFQAVLENLINLHVDNLDAI